MIHTNVALTRWGITDQKTPSRVLWHKSEFDNTNIFQLKTIEIWVKMIWSIKKWVFGSGGGQNII